MSLNSLIFTRRRKARTTLKVKGNCFEREISTKPALFPTLGISCLLTASALPAIPWSPPVLLPRCQCGLAKSSMPIHLPRPAITWSCAVHSAVPSFLQIAFWWSSEELFFRALTKLSHFTCAGDTDPGPQSLRNDDPAAIDA